MGSVTITHSGSFRNLERFIQGYSRKALIRMLDKYGMEGVTALSLVTPMDTGLSASSWDYNVGSTKNSFYIEWTNSNLTAQGTPIVILLQHGHATRGGTWIPGRDFINPAIMPIFDRIAEAIWNEVSTAHE